MGLNFSNISDALSITFSYLEPRQLLRCAQVCVRWKKIAQNPPLWNEILHRTFGLRKEQIYEIPNLIQFYKKHWTLRNNLKLGKFKKDIYFLDIHDKTAYFSKKYLVSVANKQDSVEILDFQTQQIEKVSLDSKEYCCSYYLHHDVLITGKPLEIYHIKLKKKITMEGYVIKLNKDFFAIRDKNQNYTLFDVENFKSIPFNIEQGFFQLDLKKDTLLVIRNTKLSCYHFPSLKLKYILENKNFGNIVTVKDSLFITSYKSHPMEIYDRSSGELLHDFAEIPTFGEEEYYKKIPKVLLDKGINSCEELLVEEASQLLNSIFKHKTPSEFTTTISYLFRHNKEGLSKLLGLLLKNDLQQISTTIANLLYVKKFSSKIDSDRLILLYTNENFELFDIQDKKIIMKVDTSQLITPNHHFEFILAQDRIIGARSNSETLEFDKIFIWEISSNKFIREHSLSNCKNIHIEKQLMFTYKDWLLAFFDFGNCEEINIPRITDRLRYYTNNRAFYTDDYNNK